MPFTIIIRSEDGKILAKHEALYGPESVVYLKSDPEQSKRMVSGYLVNLESMEYELVCGTECTNHAEFEISKIVESL